MKEINCVIITPVRNEGEHMDTTVRCMLTQTVKPSRWIIVDDGSSDSTPLKIKEAMEKASFIECVTLPDRGFRKPAGGVIEAFYEGLGMVRKDEYDVIAKFDADLEFPPDTLEKIFSAFKEDPRLGITGGTRYERAYGKGEFKRVLVPRGFVGGPYKFYRRKCFEDIKGLIQRAGWDGVDTIRANMKGWKTGELETLKINHLKPTGTAEGEGLRKACEKYGDVSYYMGGYVWYFLLRAVGRSMLNHSPKVGFYMLRGYLRSYFRGLERESDEFRKFLKKAQRQNVSYWLKLMLNNMNMGNAS